MEVPMPHPRTAKSNLLSVFPAVVAFLISGIVMASPNPNTQQELLIPRQQQQGHLIPSQPPQQLSTIFRVLSSLPKGLDFDPYFQNLNDSVRRKFLANVIESAGNGDNEVVVVRFQIQKDGTLADKFIKIMSSSGNKDIDDAALSAIRAAAPFGSLPEGYVGSNLDVLFRFSYKSNPPAQKPNFVPVGTAVNHIRESFTSEQP
jgi:TonB family protein